MITRLLRTTLVIFFPAFISTWSYTDVTPADVHTRLANGDTLILLDVREVPEYQNGHIAEPSGFLPITPPNMPWNSNVLQTGFNLLPMDVDIIVYCQSGVRSVAASTFLESNGFTKIYNMLGGFSSWTFESRAGGYGDHSGQWIRSSDPQPVEIICTGSGDTSKIIFPATALPAQDSIYIELHFASNKPFVPPNVPQSDMDGLFRVTALDRFGLSMFNADSLVLADTAEVILIPYFQGNIIFNPALKVFIPYEEWQTIPSNFVIPAFYRDETILRKWYNGEGWLTTDVIFSSIRPEQFEVQAFPNPFNSTLQIVAPEDALIIIYSIRGRLIEELEASFWAPDNSISSGIYVLSVKYKNKIINKGVVYLK